MMPPHATPLRLPPRACALSRGTGTGWHSLPLGHTGHPSDLLESPRRASVVRVGRTMRARPSGSAVALAEGPWRVLPCTTRALRACDQHVRVARRLASARVARVGERP